LKAPYVRILPTEEPPSEGRSVILCWQSQEPSSVPITYRVYFGAALHRNCPHAIPVTVSGCAGVCKAAFTQRSQKTAAWKEPLTRSQPSLPIFSTSRFHSQTTKANSARSITRYLQRSATQMPPLFLLCCQFLYTPLLTLWRMASETG